MAAYDTEDANRTSTYIYRSENIFYKSTNKVCI